MFELKLENADHNIIDIDDGKNYIVTGCSGLNPTSAMIFTSKSPTRKGVRYNGSTLNERQIVVSIKILGDIERNRNALYEWIDTEQYVKVHYRGEVKSVYCEGHIQDCDFDIFTDNEIINLAIICENPYWKDLSAISVDITKTLKQFAFPFSIEREGIPFSTIREGNETNVYNAGAETGCIIRIVCNGTIENLTIFDADNSTRIFKINTTLLQSWVVEINTEDSPKTCKAFLPDSTVTNLMKYVGNNPAWFTLKKGNNRFGFIADSGADNAEISVSFTNKWAGV